MAILTCPYVNGLRDSYDEEEGYHCILGTHIACHVLGIKFKDCSYYKLANSEAQ